LWKTMGGAIADVPTIEAAPGVASGGPRHPGPPPASGARPASSPSWINEPRPNPEPSETNTRSTSSPTPSPCSLAHRGGGANPGRQRSPGPRARPERGQAKGGRRTLLPFPLARPRASPNGHRVTRLHLPVAPPLSGFESLRPLETAQNQAPHNQCYEDAPEKSRPPTTPSMPGRGRTRIARIGRYGPICPGRAAARPPAYRSPPPPPT